MRVSQRATDGYEQHGNATDRFFTPQLDLTFVFVLTCACLLLRCQERRRGLQRFLTDLAAMPSPVCEDPVISQFLLCSAREWEALSASLAHAHGLGGVKGTAGAAWSFTRGLFNSMVRPNAGAESHAHDEHHDAAQASSSHHEALREHYDLMHENFEAIVLAEKELAEAWMELYAGFEISGQWRIDALGLCATAMQAVRRCVDVH